VNASRIWDGWKRLELQLSRSPAYLAPILVVGLAIAVVVIGFQYGALVAAASDASGYVSHAELWATRTLRIEPPLMRELASIPSDAFAPLAYTLGPDNTSIVPVTPPGLPLVMAMLHRTIGPHAVYWAVPIMAGMAIVATYLLGATLSRWVGLTAAVLLASSPSFLFQLTSSPMSDIPALMWWTLSLAFAMRPGAWPAVVSGLAAGAAILTRPNLVPLAAVPAVWIARGMWQERALRGLSAWRTLCFTAGAVPACVGVAMLFNFWYGSPFKSGYGDASHLYAWGHLWTNLARYPRWLVESQTPIVAIAAIAPLVLRGASFALIERRDAVPRAFTLLIFVAGVFACYALYLPFDAWWFLRFLLPAYAPLLVLTSATIVVLATRALQPVRTTAVMAIVAVVAFQTVNYARAASAFNVLGEWKYEDAGLYVAKHVPERSAVLASQHSGSVRHYAGRPTLLFPRIPADRLDEVISELRRMSYATFLLLEDWEEETFRSQFAGEDAVAAITRPPVAELTGGEARIYSVRLYRLD
jgi:hypothetical protein